MLRRPTIPTTQTRTTCDHARKEVNPMSKKKPDESVHPLAPMLVECFTLANAFEALAADARKDANEAQAEMDALLAGAGFQRKLRGDVEKLFDLQVDRLDAARAVIERCETLVDTLRQQPLYVRDALDELMLANECAAPSKAPAP